MTAPSAKSLFRATKRRAPALGRGLMDLHDQSAPQATRRADDFYPTGQPEAIRALLARDGNRIRMCGKVWEPAVGDGALAREIEAAGVPVVGSDIVDRGWPGTRVCSFFDFNQPLADAIITNPPFSLINARDGKGAWLRHTLGLKSWNYCALLLSWDWPAARQNGLGALLDAHPFSWCYLMRWKLDFTGEGSPPQRNAWFVWDRHDPRGPKRGNPHPDFRWLDRDDARQGVLL
jgi:hypothetical protein